MRVNVFIIEKLTDSEYVVESYGEHPADIVSKERAVVDSQGGA